MSGKGGLSGIFVCEATHSASGGSYGQKKQDPMFSDAQIDAVVAGATTATEMEAIFSQLKKRIIERMLAGESTSHSRRAALRRGEAGRPAESPQWVDAEDGDHGERRGAAFDVRRDRAGVLRRSSCPRACGDSRSLMRRCSRSTRGG